MFETILIANRGEIACRIARTCRRLGVRSVAVYSDADREAAHVAACDEAWPVGPAPAGESYLNGARILAAARQSGAAAIHPGYGFLSENAAFARACAEAGIVFIGPPPAAIAAMGSKAAAKRRMAEAGVPLVPGYHDDGQDPGALAEAADDLGYPVLIKAVAGGGGTGLRRADSADAFAAELAAARREAAAAFGDDRVLVERCLDGARHVEVQVFADTHGTVVHLFERDCSIQRRHQKLIEEAPAPGLDPATRAEMGAAAVRAAQAIGYVGAGTVEFLLAPDGAFYFMEMNTRLQVEHPVTEMITGHDLVDWQLRVAAGAPLPVTQNDLAIQGHAIEARVYAEDPARDFMPASGTLAAVRTPPETPYVRVDSGVRTGDHVPIHYDSMLAKLIVWGESRAEARRRLRAALDRFHVVGLANNLAFLRAVTAHSAFAEGAVDTGFVAAQRDSLRSPPTPAPEAALAAAVLAELSRFEAEARARAAAAGVPGSPWFAADSFRLNGAGHQIVQLQDAGQTVAVTCWVQANHVVLDLPGGSVAARATPTGESDAELRVDLDGRRFTAGIVRMAESLAVLLDGGCHVLGLGDPGAATRTGAAPDPDLTAPMPGRITQVHVAPGTEVRAGDPLLVLEAMKMEYTLTAPRAGRVTALACAVGETVDQGAPLLVLDEVPAAETAP